MTREQLDEHIRQLVAAWPPLTAEQRERLRVLFRTAPSSEATPQRKAA